VQKIPFPQKQSNILGLKTLQDNLAQEIALLTDTVKISFSKIERSLLTLPKLNETELGRRISAVSMQSKLEEKNQWTRRIEQPNRLFMEKYQNPYGNCINNYSAKKICSDYSIH
jgi:hypothetical protein